MKFLIREQIKLLLLYYSKQNIITKLQKLYSLLRNLWASNKLPVPISKKPLCTGNLSSVHKIFIERPVMEEKKYDCLILDYLEQFIIYKCENKILVLLVLTDSLSVEKNIFGTTSGLNTSA